MGWGEEGCPNKKKWGPTKNSKINPRGWGGGRRGVQIRKSGVRQKIQKLISGGGLLFGTEEYEICSKLMIKTIIIITQ